MEQNNYNNGPEGGGFDWYAPNFPQKAEQTPGGQTQSPPPRKPRKKRTGMKVTMIVLCVIVLIAASAFLFSTGDSKPLWDFSLSIPGFEIHRGSGDSTQTDVPDNFFNDFGGLPGVDGDMPDNFRDFFNSYYTVEETIGPNTIERTEPAGSFDLALDSCEGREELGLQQLYSRLTPSIVGIMAYMGDSGYGWGTGVIAHTDGYIITNAHVLSGADSCTVVLFNGRELEALLVGSDLKTDLAVLKIEAKGLVPASFGDSGELAVGDKVVAIGNPLGDQFSGTMTDGIVSAINRNVDYLGTHMDLIQTNAALNEGNSGGPLINIYGQVVGITNMKMVNNYGATIEGIGFAIPSTTVKEIVDKLISEGEVSGRPSIGIMSGSVPPEAMEEYGLPEGLYITEVFDGSDAKAQGILPGDVLTHVNGQKVTTTDEVISIRDAHSIGDKLTMTIFRDGESFDVDVEIYDSLKING